MVNTFTKEGNPTAATPRVYQVHWFEADRDTGHWRSTGVESFVLGLQDDMSILTLGDLPWLISQHPSCTSTISEIEIRSVQLIGYDQTTKEDHASGQAEIG